MATRVTGTYLYSLEWDEEIEAVVFTWNEFASGQRFRKGANELLEFIRSKNASKLIVDASGIKVHDNEDQRWLAEEWLPKIIDAGIEYTATVYEDTPLAEMEMKSLRPHLEGHPITAIVTVDKDEAREWIAVQ